MKQIISINIGHGGIRFGNACWQLFCLEHSIDPSGHLNNSNDFFQDDLPLTFFSETFSGKYVPKAIMVDLEPTLIEDIQCGTFRKLFYPQNLISGKEDASSNFARGQNIANKKILDLTLDKIRILADTCENLQGFIISQTVGGGTGSGFGSQLLKRLSEDYSKKLKMDFAIYPSHKLSTSCTQPYNAVLAAHSLRQHADICVVLDNEALYDICSHQLDIYHPTYKNLNEVMSQLFSSLTSSIRFDGCLNQDLCEFQKNLVPIPRVNFMLSSLAPITNRQKCCWTDFQSHPVITNEVFQLRNLMVKCDPNQGKYIACSLMYRGDIIPRDVNLAIASLKTKKTIQFVDWCPTGFRVGLTYKLPVVIPDGEMGKVLRSCCMISNSTAITQHFSKLNHKFDMMYAKKAFLHWYRKEGMEEDTFREARQDLAALEKDYEEMAEDAVDYDNIQ